MTTEPNQPGYGPTPWNTRRVLDDPLGGGGWCQDCGEHRVEPGKSRCPICGPVAVDRHAKIAQALHQVDSQDEARAAQHDPTRLSAERQNTLRRFAYIAPTPAGRASHVVWSADRDKRMAALNPCHGAICRYGRATHLAATSGVAYSPERVIEWVWREADETDPSGYRAVLVPLTLQEVVHIARACANQCGAGDDIPWRVDTDPEQGAR